MSDPSESPAAELERLEARLVEILASGHARDLAETRAEESRIRARDLRRHLEG